MPHGRPSAKHPSMIRRSTIQHLELLQKREVIARMYIQGKLQQEIADEMGVSRTMIGQHLRALQREWRESSLFDFGEAKAKELAKLDVVEREAWAAWEASKTEKDITYYGKVKVGHEKGSGNTSYLEVVMRCIERRCKILGLDAPTKSMNVSIPWDSLSDDQVAALVAGEEPLKVLGERMHVVNAAPMIIEGQVVEGEQA